jgi:hypothetical protein
MTLLRFPNSKRGYLIGILAGVVTTIGVNIVGRLLIHLGLHADLTYLDDGLLGVLIALLVFVLHRHHDIERREHYERVTALIALHQGIAADLQAIASITGNIALAEIANDAAIRIHTIIEQLPTAEDMLEESSRLTIKKAQRRLAV